MNGCTTAVSASSSKVKTRIRLVGLKTLQNYVIMAELTVKKA